MYGVEPICAQLQIAPSAYRRHAARQRDPSLRSQRTQRDDQLITDIQRVWQDNHGVYGAAKVWRQLNREGISVARCTVERLMRAHGLQGVRRGKRVRTTVPDGAADRPLDRVNRQFHADRPNQLWVSDFTSHRRLAGQRVHDHRLRAGRAGTGSVRPPARRRGYPDPPFGQRVAIREHPLQ